MKYIRTKDGRIIDLTSKQVSSYEIIDDKRDLDEYGEDDGFIMVYYYNEDIGEHLEYDGKGGCSMDNWYLKDIIKQADDLIELCDKFVSNNKGKVKLLKPKYISPSENFVQSWINSFEEEIVLKGNREIFGCIWVFDNNGVPTLKPVIEMNEKGEWKLL